MAPDISFQSTATCFDHESATLFQTPHYTFRRVSSAFYPFLHTILKRKERLSHTTPYPSPPPDLSTFTYPGTRPDRTLPVFSTRSAYLLVKLIR